MRLRETFFGFNNYAETITFMQCNVIKGSEPNETNVYVNLYFSKGL